MKKFFALTLLISSIFSTQAFAVTEGSYLSIDGVDSHVSYYERFSNTAFPNGLNLRPSYKNNRYGYGLTYKYAVNYNKFYLAPGAFFERNDAKTFDTDTSKKIHIKNRFGAKLDLGYDVALGYTPIEIFSLYVTGGYSGVKYETTNRLSTNKIDVNRSGTAGDWFYGAGFKADFNERFFFGAEYTTQNFLAKTAVIDAGTQYQGKYKTRLDVFKVSLGYKF